MPSGCEPSPRPFRPSVVRIADLDVRAGVVARGRDAQGVPRTPPVTPRGLWQFAWDTWSGIRPGDQYGVVKLNAHTAPGGKALGNRLINRLRVGQRIVVSGASGQRLCYQVTSKYTVPAKRRLLAYYETAGRPKLGILVCSGKRLGPGNWTHRTIWFAKPLT